MIRIHKEGRVIVFLTFAVLLVIVIASARFLPYQLNYITSIASMVILVLVMRFFRNPQRRPFLEEKTITAPSDGKVVVIEKVEEKEFLNGPCTQVSIFMSIHDVHINYFPVNGRIGYLKYHPGNYLVARHPKSSEQNERTSMGIDTPFGSLLVRQVAGFVARRIRCYVTQGAAARQGKEFGFIKFGSRLDLFIPPDTDIQVELNQKVTGGVTPVARFK